MDRTKYYKKFNKLKFKKFFELEKYDFDNFEELNSFLKKIISLCSNEPYYYKAQVGNKEYSVQFDNTNDMENHILNSNEISYVHIRVINLDTEKYDMIALYINFIENSNDVSFIQIASERKEWIISSSHIINKELQLILNKIYKNKKYIWIFWFLFGVFYISQKFCSIEFIDYKKFQITFNHLENIQFDIIFIVLIIPNYFRYLLKTLIPTFRLKTNGKFKFINKLRVNLEEPINLISFILTIAYPIFELLGFLKRLFIF